MATYSIKVLKEGRTVTRKQITQGLLRTEAAVIKAGADQAYVLSDALLENKAPAKIQTRRVGKNLHLALGDSSVAAPDLIIEGYFDFPPAPILGTLADGTTVAYDMSLIVGLAQGDGVAVGTGNAAGSNAAAGVESGLADPKPYAGMSGAQLAAIGLGALALGGGGGGGGGGSAAPAPTEAQTSQTKINAYANDNTQPAPSAADYAALGVSGVTASNLSAVNSAVDALNGSGVDSAGKIQALVDAYNKILAEANGSTADATPGNNSTAAQYAAIGANIGAAASSSEGLALLGEVIGSKSTTDVDTIAEINALAAAVNSVMAAAAGDTALKLAELSLLGITGVVPDNLAAVQAGIAATPDSGAGINSLASLQAVVNSATGLATVSNYASSNTNAAPTLAHYTQLNVEGVTSSNLSAVNSAIDALSAANVDTPAKIQLVVNAYAKILAEANGATADATPASSPLASDYAAIGANIGAAASNSTNLALLNDVLASRASADVDSIAEINALAAAANAVMKGAAGDAAPDIGQLALLGLTGVTADNLAAVQAGIAATADSGTGVDTVAELQAIVSTATSLTTIGSFAASNANAAPTLADYSQLGIAGVSSANLAAINSAIDVLATADVNSAAKVQAVVDAYSRILAEANGTAADASPSVNPFAGDYAAIGANAGLAAGNTSALALLNDIVGNQNATAVDTVAKINGLSQVVDKLMNKAAGTGTGLALADFNTIGVATAGTGAVTSINLGAVNEAIGQAGGQNRIDTLLELQALVTAVATIVTYADDNSQAAPLLAAYTNAGLAEVTAINLAAINSAIDAKAIADVDTKAEVQTIIDTYNTILAEANGAVSDATPGLNPIAAQYATIGAQIGNSVTDAENLGLLNDALGNLSTVNVDSVAKINALAATVDKVMNLAAQASGSTIPAGAPSMAELGALGLNTSLADTAAEQTAVWQAIVESADSGTGVDTVAELKAIVDKVSSLATIGNYAASKTNTAPTSTDYSQSDVTGVSSTNLEAINSAVDALAAADVNSTAKVQAVVDAYIKILAEANGETADASPGNNPLASDYAAIGASIGLAAGNASALSLLDDIVGNLSTASVDTVAKIDGLSLVVDKLMKKAAGTDADLTVADFTTIGIGTTGTGAVTTANLSAVTQAITLAGGQDRIDTLSELRNVISSASATLSLATIGNYAASNSSTAPTLADYSQLGITGVSGTNLAAINSAVDALATADVNSVAKVQAVATAYNRILTEANSAAADPNPAVNPLASDYAAIGATAGLAASNVSALALLNDLVGRKIAAEVDTVAEINRLAELVDKFMITATGTNANLALSDFTELGIATSGVGAVTSANLSAVIEAISQAEGQDHIDTMLELQTLATAVATIVTYASDNQTVPTLQAYTNAGLTGVTSSNLAAINSAIDANSIGNVDTKAEVQTIIDTYRAILAEANGTAADATPGNNPGAAQYALIGAQIGISATDEENLGLLNDALGNLNTVNVDSVAEINALAATVNKVMILAAQASGSTVPTDAPSMTELGALGLSTGLVDTAAERTAVWQAIVNSDDSGTGVATILQLQALINANAL